MSGQHTPGPWFVAADPRPKATHPEARKFAHNLYRFVATGPELDDDGTEQVVCSMMDGPEQVANAYLIAAAPELLAALEGLLADPYLSHSINNDRMAPARAAIAKAKGGA
jgi:uncharacterized protein YciI